MDRIDDFMQLSCEKIALGRTRRASALDRDFRPLEGVARRQSQNQRGAQSVEAEHLAAAQAAKVRVFVALVEHRAEPPGSILTRHCVGQSLLDQPFQNAIQGDTIKMFSAFAELGRYRVMAERVRRIQQRGQRRQARRRHPLTLRLQALPGSFDGHGVGAVFCSWRYEIIKNNDAQHSCIICYSCLPYLGFKALQEIQVVPEKRTMEPT